MSTDSSLHQIKSELLLLGKMKHKHLNVKKDAKTIYFSREITDNYFVDKKSGKMAQLKHILKKKIEQFRSRLN